MLAHCNKYLKTRVLISQQTRIIYITNLLTNYLEESASCEADSSSAIQDITDILRNLDDQNRIRKRQITVLILAQINPVHETMIRFNIILPFKPGPSK
jgi:DNA-directed RNA polymerase subunit F